MLEGRAAGLRIAMVAGEVSGDALGAGLIGALREIYPKAEFRGVGGTGMIHAGLRTLFPMDKLSVMGLFEVLARLPELLTLRRRLVSDLLADPPDVYVGIDAPDFNLTVERRLKARGVTTVHYVSPTVWAWRQRRVRKIARAVDLMLTLFPFEARFFEHWRVPVRTVGHPLADEVGDGMDRTDSRRALGLSLGEPVLALLPGSRLAELQRMGTDMFGAAAWLAQRVDNLQIVVPCATAAIRAQVATLIEDNPVKSRTLLLDGSSRHAIAASDVVLLASGTATLETALLARPMVVVYRMNRLTFALARRLVKVPWVALPNLLAGRKLVPEFLQDEVRPEVLGPALLEMLDPKVDLSEMLAAFDDIRRDLRRDANRAAAEAIRALLEQRGVC